MKLDRVNLKANKAWEYRSTPDLYAPCCSSVERLENGNTVLVFGNDPTRQNCCGVFTLVEADAHQATVSAIEIRSPGKVSQYRAYALDSIYGESESNRPQPCNGLAATITGTAGPDTIQGTPGDDIIVGLGGDDSIYGLGGLDTICGGPGNDRISGGDLNDWISGDAGNDKLMGDAGNDQLMGGPGHDILIGGIGGDWLFGGEARDWIYGGGGKDHLFGQQGPDILSGGDHDDIVKGGSGDDAIKCGPGVDSGDGRSGSGDTATADCETVIDVP